MLFQIWSCSFVRSGCCQDVGSTVEVCLIKLDSNNVKAHASTLGDAAAVMTDEYPVYPVSMLSGCFGLWTRSCVKPSPGSDYEAAIVSEEPKRRMSEVAIPGS